MEKYEEAIASDNVLKFFKVLKNYDYIAPICHPIVDSINAGSHKILEYLIKYQHYEIKYYLGPDYKITPLEIAILDNKFECVKVLVENGAIDRNYGYLGFNYIGKVLSFSLRYSTIEITEYLLENIDFYESEFKYIIDLKESKVLFTDENAKYIDDVIVKKYEQLKRSRARIPYLAILKECGFT